jgi:FMN phosphatase YigB (HAD superfamily)
MRPRRPTCRLRHRGEMKFVLFDLDDTLTDRHASLERYVARLRAAPRTCVHPLGLVTNGPVGLQQGKIDEVGIGRLFATIVISEQVGVHKPDPRVFQRALDQLACTGAEAWFVGDHPRNDVLGAAGVGMQPIWLTGVHPWPDGVERPGHRIDRIEDVMRAVMGEID